MELLNTRLQSSANQAKLSHRASAILLVGKEPNLLFLTKALALADTE